MIDNHLNFTFEFICHGKEGYMDLQKEKATINVTMDIDYDGTKCTCAVYDEDKLREESEMTLNISLYRPVLKLFPEYIVSYGYSVTLTCIAESLTYPFGLGNWLYASHNKEHQWLEVKQIPSKTAVTINNTRNSTSLIFRNITYEQMGRYQCRVFDQRKSNLVVGNSTTRLMVEGPIFLDDISLKRHNNSCKIQAIFRSFSNISVISLWENYYRVKNVEMKERNTTKGDLLRHNYSSDPFSCSDNSTYGLIASNELTTTKRYFNSAGIILKSSLILQIHGKLIDGHQVSVVCYEISLANASYLSLTCDNIKHTTSHDSIDDHAPVVQTSYIADVDDINVCNCSNTCTGESEVVDIQVNPYKSLNETSFREKCGSSSKITLKCSYPDLPKSFLVNGWVHQFNGVYIRELDGSPNGKENILHIPFCTYEDIGNYICIVVDCRKNKTILNSTTIYLDIPGPPVIVNTSVVKVGSRQGCSLNVSFYSFGVVSMTAWYKNGKQLISSESMKQGLVEHKHHVAMHGSFVPIDSYVASLNIKSMCDVEDNIYNFTTSTGVYKTSHIFQADDHPVRKVLIVSMIVATGIFVAGLNVTICKAFRDAKETKRWVYTRPIPGIRDTLFYEEVDMEIENMRQHDQEIEGARPLTFCESTYEQIPHDIDVSTAV